MRKFVPLILFSALALVVINLGEAQQGQFGGFGKGKGGGGGFDYFTLANNFQVKSELKITEAQTAKMPAAAWKALSEVLDAGQLKRLKEIYLRQKGNAAFLEPDVKKELKITDEQSTKIKAAMDAQVKDQQEMFQNGFDADRFQEIQKTATTAVQAVLTDAQKSTWTKMIGEPFEMKGFGGFGKKKD